MPIVARLCLCFTLSLFTIWLSTWSNLNAFSDLLKFSRAVHLHIVHMKLKLQYTERPDIIPLHLRPLISPDLNPVDWLTCTVCQSSTVNSALEFFC